MFAVFSGHIFLSWVKDRKNIYFSGKWSLFSWKETPEISVFVSPEMVLWVCASTPHGIKMPHTKIKELIFREEDSEAQWARCLSLSCCYKTQRMKQFLFNHKSPMCCLCLSSCGLFQLVFFCTFSSIFPHCKVLCCAVGPLDAWEINDAVQNLSQFISRPWSILATLPPLL